MPAATGFLWGILTYWGPIFATFLFGMMLYTTLPDAALPKSKVEGGTNGAGFIQSLVTFFNANGCLWLMVLLVVRKYASVVEKSAPTTVEAEETTKEQAQDRDGPGR